MIVPTQDMIDEIRYHATWTLHRQGEPGCAARVRAGYLLAFLDEYERIRKESLEVEVDLDGVV